MTVWKWAHALDHGLGIKWASMLATDLGCGSGNGSDGMMAQGLGTKMEMESVLEWVYVWAQELALQLERELVGKLATVLVVVMVMVLEHVLAETWATVLVQRLAKVWGHGSAVEWVLELEQGMASLLEYELVLGLAHGLVELLGMT
jgi:hypothetical protein